MKRLLAALLFTAPALLAQERATGYIPLTAAEYARQPGWRAPAVGARTRAQVDLRAYMPPVGDQGDQSSCVGWTVAYACGGYYEGIRRGRKPTGPDLQLSPAYVYNQITIPGKDGMGNGAHIWEALRLWRRQGIAPFRSMPYDVRSARARPSVEASKEARQHTILDYGKLTRGDQIKLALSLFKPVAVGIRTTPRFHRPEEWTHYSLHDDETGIAEQEDYWEKHKTKSEDRRFGGHAITLVGYDDSRQAFLAQNSWGSKWADNGYCWMRFELFETINGSGTFCHAAYVVQSRRAVHPRAYQWMYGSTGVQLHSLKWREKGRWHFTVEVSPLSERYDDIARIEWARGARTATGSMFEGTADRPGLVEVAAIVHLKD
ncbi:MAG: C1 family peptidase, partial [Planctomycetota bacterium]